MCTHLAILSIDICVHIVYNIITGLRKTETKERKHDNEPERTESKSDGNLQSSESKIHGEHEQRGLENVLRCKNGLHEVRR